MGRPGFKQWLRYRAKDIYISLAKDRNFRARSAFKLEEINNKQKFLKPDSLVVDLGAAPGGWSQVALENMTRKDKWSLMRPVKRPNIVSVDLLPIEVLDGCYRIQDDFSHTEVRDHIIEFFNSKVDVVMSDCAPQRSGMLTVDHYRQIRLCYTALEFATTILKPGAESVFLCKIYQGPDEYDFRRELRKHFSKLIYFKPKATRPSSREYYMFAKGFNV